MNFFEYQARARKQSRWIIIAFILVTLLIVAAVNLIVLSLIGFHAPIAAGTSYITQQNITGFNLQSLLSSDFLMQHINAIMGSSAATAGVIGLASLGKISSLKSGGGKVAKDLGGTLVTNDTVDPLRRRLLNVVEEISLASGVPVPGVYVLENEPGINAFAAGYSTSDAAVAVTQGCLEKLSRSELQGVIAHEFSHILNGDMRINIRLMGVIFGILVIAIVGRKFMSSGRHVRTSSRDGGGLTAVVAIGLALMLVGYIGLFFSRWMKAALSRQREYLADASAIQFTREPQGLSGALKKIAAYNHRSYLKTDSEEVSHMLFGQGYRSLMFATHPPLEKRIKRVEKNFKQEDIKELAEKLREQERKEHLQAVQAEKEAEQKLADKSKPSFNPADIVNQIGSPDFERVLAAAMLLSKIPDELTSAAHSVEWAPEVLFYTLLDNNKKIRDEQLMIVMEHMGEHSETKLRHLVASKRKLPAEFRLPLLEMVFPVLKRRPQEDINKIITTIMHLIQADGKIDSFEYLLSKIITMQLQESAFPHKSKLNGKRKLKECEQQVFDVISILAAHGHDDVHDTQKAYEYGVKGLGLSDSNVLLVQDWVARLDEALPILNELKPEEKNKLVEAFARTVNLDNKLVTEEHEMFRAICASIHVPLPLLKAVPSGSKKAGKQLEIDMDL